MLRRSSVTGGDQLLRLDDLSLDPEKRQAWRGDRELGLTKTEFDLLELLLFNAGVVVTRDTIYERIWGYEFETSSKSLDVYIGYLRRKTEADGESRLIHTVRGVGYTVRTWHRMSLRMRLALVVATTFAAVVVACVFAAHVSARNATARRDRSIPRATGVGSTLLARGRRLTAAEAAAVRSRST